MTTETTVHADGAVLVAEMQRYLAAVEAFRAEGREPSWLPEQAPRRITAARRRKVQERMS
jgi:hypothetical protein